MLEAGHVCEILLSRFNIRRLLTRLLFFLILCRDAGCHATRTMIVGKATVWIKRVEARCSSLRLRLLEHSSVSKGHLTPSNGALLVCRLLFLRASLTVRLGS